MTHLTPNKKGALGGPVPARTTAVLLAGQHDQRYLLIAVSLRTVKHVHHVTASHVLCPGSGSAHHLVDKADISEGAPRHDRVVAAPRPVGVELPRRQVARGEVSCRRRVPSDAP